MASKGSYTANLLLIASVAALAYVIRRPLLPLKIETKQSWGYPKDSLLNFTELTAKYGYLSEEHTATTEDGYLLKLFRVVRGSNCVGTVKQPPVILMHGLLQSADAWLDAGPGAGLAYLLADTCRDLWVGNVRGNYYSRRHISLNPDKDPQFWQFHVHEIGFYDIPATIDYVLNYTDSKKVNYIGYSQGSGAFLVMCSERPEYSEKVQLFIGLAPASRQTNTKSVMYRNFVVSVSRMSSVLSRLGVQEMLSKGSLFQEIMAFVCQMPATSHYLCENLEALLDSNHPGSITNETTRVLFGHFPAGTSLKSLTWYGQSMNIEGFEKFDYGKEQNLQVYGDIRPPAYNLSAVTTPAVVFYGTNDYMVDSRDVEWLIKKLPNVIEAVVVKDTQWNHIDVPYSRHTSELIFPKLNEYLEKYSYA